MIFHLTSTESNEIIVIMISGHNENSSHVIVDEMKWQVILIVYFNGRIDSLELSLCDFQDT